MAFKTRKIGRPPNQVRITKDRSGRFRLSWRGTDGQRQQGSCPSVREAEDRAREISENLKCQRPEAPRLADQQAEEFLAAQRITDRHNRSVYEVVQEWAAATTALPKGVSVIEAARSYAPEPLSIQAIQVDEAAQLYLADSVARGNSLSHQRNQRAVMALFTGTFACEVSAIDRATLSAWVASLTDLGPKTRNDYSREIRTFIRWAQRRDYLPQDSRLQEALTTERVAPQSVHIYRPAELWAILDACVPWLKPRIALIALAGARTAEAVRLTSAEVKDGWVALDAHITKTQRRRAIPVCPALQEILTEGAAHLTRAVEGPGGSQMSADALFRRTYDKALRDAGVTKVTNGLRHGFCSYRVAMTSDVAKTSLESGNSPAMIDRHYKAIVTKEEAKEWFRCEDF